MEWLLFLAFITVVVVKLSSRNKKENVKDISQVKEIDKHTKNFFYEKKPGIRTLEKTDMILDHSIINKENDETEIILKDMKLKYLVQQMDKKEPPFYKKNIK